MTMATAFLGGAKERLLPASVPFRFFLAAALFHVAAWVALLLGAGDLAGFRGGPGPVLAAIHLLTLGVLAMTAMGAGYQLLPVVTRRPLGRAWPARLSFWAMVPGVAVLGWGMGQGGIAPMRVGGGLVLVGLALFAGLTARNLSRAGSIAAIAAHGWAALAALVAVAGLGMTLIEDFPRGFLDDRAALALLHMGLATFGFMGLLVGGFSMVLVPMFVLSRSLPARPGWIQLGLAAAALAAFAAAATGAAGAAAAWWGALALGLGAAGVHLWLMRLAEARAMRRRPDLAIRLIRAGRWMLPAALILAAAGSAGPPLPRIAALTGFVALAGWLLTFLLGVLQRIMPFLASMHAAGASGLPMLMSELSARTPLRIHAATHFPALAAVAAGIALDSEALIRAGAGLGVIAAAAFAAFAFGVAYRLWRAIGRAGRNGAGQGRRGQNGAGRGEGGATGRRGG